jgi:hypothetical protein
MEINNEIVQELRKFDRKFAKATPEQIMQGYEISLTVKEFEHPEDRLTFAELLALSTFYTYESIVTQKKLQSEPIDDSYYQFSAEELADEA